MGVGSAEECAAIRKLRLSLNRDWSSSSCRKGEGAEEVHNFAYSGDDTTFMKALGLDRIAPPCGIFDAWCMEFRFFLTSGLDLMIHERPLVKRLREKLHICIERREIVEGD